MFHLPQFHIPSFRLPPVIAQVGLLLPQWPHSLALVSALNVGARLGYLPADTLQQLEGKHFRVCVSDTGAQADYTYQNGFFKPVFSDVISPDLTFRASLAVFLQLLTRQEDPDTFFFNRELEVTGDTELGLLCKNMLDAVEWPGFMRSV